MGEVIIVKMTQKIELNPHYPASEQISKMVVDLVKKQMIAIYHLNEGEISPKIKVFEKEDIIGAKISDSSGEKKSEDPIKMQENQAMLGMERDCYNQIKIQEGNAGDEDKLVREEKLVLEKTLHDRAREKYKYALEKNDDDLDKEEMKNDYLYPFLEKRGWFGKELNNYEASTIKSDVLEKLKNRYFYINKLL